MNNRYKKRLIKSRIMDFVEGKGEACYTEIIKFIVEEVKGYIYDSYNHRGYYACAFSGFNPYLREPSKREPRYLKKKENGKYAVFTD